MKTKQTLIGATCILLVWGYGSPERAFQERDKWGSRQTFKWKISITTRFSAAVWNELSQLPPEAQQKLRASNPDLKPYEPVSRRAEMLLTVMRSNRTDILEFQIVSREDGVRLIFDHASEQLLLIVRPEMSATHDSSAHRQNTSNNGIANAFVFPTGDSPLYLGVPSYYSGIGAEVNVFHGAFLAAVNPLRVEAPFGWMGFKRVEWLPNSAVSNEFILQVDGAKAGTMTISPEHGYAPALLRIEYGKLRFQWRVKQWKQVAGYWMPSLIEYERKDRMVSEQAYIELVAASPTPPDAVKNLSEYLTRGVQVTDFRLAGGITDSPMHLREQDVVSYGFDQHLPSVEELQQLAYQQGNLVPPETPQRRDSLWLFVPAALFFLAAAYLYLRGKRK
ncbi:MAG: hypothetical protein KatS3mg019_1707 [Fimbriimonadales bacterium]|nr:MAG: hypothetical protein KatS3mg019_1707 [Fimbriimonadales bacterium]